MAKRFEPNNTFGPAKKLKLDVNVHRGHSSSTSSKIVDFWASDDDDFILLATQQAERKLDDGVQNTESEFVFSEFAPQIHGGTSTQQILEAVPNSRFPRKVSMEEGLNISHHINLSVEEIFGTDETFVFLPDTKAEKKSSTEIRQLTDCSFSQATASRRQLAQERQLKFLMERVDILKKENLKLQKDLLDINKQAGTKDGEVSLLRDELRQARKLIQASKMEKIALAEEAEKDCNKKVAEVFKIVVAKDAELNFTNVEISGLKIRNAQNSDRRISKENQKPRIGVSDDIRNLLRIEHLCVDSSSATKVPSVTFNNHVYEHSKEKRGVKQRTFFEIELDALHLHYAQLQSKTSCVETITERIFLTVCRVFTEFWCYADRLELPQNCMLYPYYHFDLQLDHSISKRDTLFQSGALYDLERSVLLRRYFATLTLICQNQNRISQSLLARKHGKHYLIQIVTEAITKLSYSLEVREHFGVIEAAAEFLNSLLDNAFKVSSVSETQLELLFTFLKELVFTRPSPWVFLQLSKCMLLCMRHSKMIEKMCIKSPSNYFLSDRVRSFYRFAPNSCLMQVYSGLIELCFSGDQPLSPSHFELLLLICENHVRFVYQCFTTTPDFILRMLPLSSFADDEKEGNDEMLPKVTCLHSDVTLSNNTTKTSEFTKTNISDLTPIPVQPLISHEHGCECYVKLCLSVLTLIFQTIYQWMLQDKKSGTSQVSGISQIGVQLLTIIFREYYLTCLFRDSEETTKHYLCLLCNWWNDNSQLLGFENIHVRFLRQLQDLQFMLKPLHQEGNLSNINTDLDEWTRISGNADANIPKYIPPDVSNNTGALFIYNTSDFFNGIKRVTYNFE